MPEEDNSLDANSGTKLYDATSSSLETVAPVVQSIPARRRPSLFKFNRLAFSVTAGALATIAVIIGIAFLFNNAQSSKANEIANKKDNYDVGSLSLNGVQQTDQLKVGTADSLDVNGQLQVSNTVVLTPTTAPTTPEAGQIYYDKTVNSLFYYNGSVFVPVANQNAIVSSLGGMTGAVNAGAGLSAVGGSLQNTGVLSIQGQTGNVTFTAGGGVDISGTTVSLTALPAGQLVLGTGASGFTTVAQAAPGQCLISTAGAPVFGSCTGSTQVTSLNGLINGVTLAQGTGITITPSGNTLTIASSAGAAITSLNGETGPTLTISNASVTAANTITINNAAADGSTKGIATFSGTNFTSPSAGVIDTIQGIGTSATPTFGSLALTNGLRNGSDLFAVPSHSGGGTLCYVNAGTTNCPTGGDVTKGGTYNNGYITYTDPSTGLLNTTNLKVQSGGLQNTIDQTYFLDLKNSNDSTFTLTNTNGGGKVANLSVQGTITSGGLQNGSDLFAIPTNGGSGGTLCYVNGASTNCPTGGDVSYDGTPTSGTFPIFTALGIANSALLQNAGNLSTTGSFTATGGVIADTVTSNSGGSDLVITSTNNNIQFSINNGARVFTFDTGGSTQYQTICTTGISCAAGGGTAVILGGTGPQAHITADPGIWLKTTTGTGNLVTLQNNANSDIFTISSSGATTISNSGGLTIGKIGAGGITGSLNLANSASSFLGTLQVASLGQNTTYTLPDPGGNASICLTTGNCTGAGFGIGGSGTDGRIALFTSGGASVGDSALSQSSGNLTATGSLTLQGGTATLGVANTQTGSINFKRSDSLTFSGTLIQGALSSNQTYTLPDVSGEVCLTIGNCIGGSSGGAPSSAQYLTLALDGGLSSERVLTAGTNIASFVDGGPNGTLTVAVANSPAFSGLVTANGGLTVATGQTLTVNGNAYTSLTGTGLQFSGGTLQTTLGTSVDLASAEVTGTLPVANGGTGAATFTSKGVLYGNTTGAVQATALGSSGQILFANALGTPTFTTLGGDASVVAAGTLTVNKLQNNTLTLGSLASGEVLQYNGTAIVNGKITDSNLQAGTFANITGTGALAAGSIASGFGTISTGNNITTTATVQGNNVNATNQLQIGGADINVAGTLNNVAYLNATTNTFTGNLAQTGFKTFSTGTGAISLNGDTSVASGKTFTLQGSGTSSLIGKTAAGDQSTISMITGGKTIVYTLDSSQANVINGQTYKICTSVGNCTGAAGGGITSTGGDKYLPIFNSDGYTFANSIILQDSVSSPTYASVAGKLRVSTLGSAGSTALCANGSNEIATCSSTGSTLQSAYAASLGSTTPEILLNATQGAVDIQNAFTGGVSGGNLFTVRGGVSGDLTTGSTVYLGVTDTGTVNVNTTGSGVTNINTGTGSGAVNIGNDTGNTALTLASGTGAINIGTGSQARTVNIATGAAAQTLTLGSATSTSATTLQSGSGALNIQSQASINIGANAVAQNITVGNSTGTSSVSINCGTGTCGLGNNATDHSTTVGSVTGVAATTLQGGTGGISASSTTVSGTAFNLTASSLTTGTGLNVAVNSMTSGNGLKVSSSSASLTSGNLAYINQTGTYTTSVAIQNTGLNIARAVANNYTSSAGVSFDSTASSSGSNTAATTHTVGGYSNRYLTASVSMFANSGTFTCAVTYGGVSMTQLVVTSGTSGFTTQTAIFGLASPAIGTATVSASCSGTNTVSNLFLTSISWYNVDQSAPTGVGATGTTSVAPASATTDYVVDAFAGQSVGGPTAGQTQPPGAYASYKVGATPTTTMSWSYSGAPPPTLVAIAIKKASSGGAELYGPVATLSSSCSNTAGTCLDSSNILKLNQSYGNATGAVLNIQNAGSGASLQTQNSSDNGLSLSALNNAGSSIFNVDTSNLIKNSNFETDINNWSNVSGSFPSLAQNAGSARYGSYGAQVSAIAAGTLTGNLKSTLAANTTYTFSFWARNSTFASSDTVTITVGGAACPTTVTVPNNGAWAQYSCTVTTGASPTNTVVLSINAFYGWDFDAVRVNKGSTITTGEVNIAGTLNSTGSALFKNSTNTAAAFQIQNSSGVPLINADTLNNSVNLNGAYYSTGTIAQTTTAVTGTSTVFVAGMVGGTLIYGDGTTSTITAFTDSTHITVSVSKTVASGTPYTIRWGGLNIKNDGTGTLQTTTNSTTAFTIQNSTGSSLLTADTTNTRLNIGTNGTTTAQLFIAGNMPSANLNYAGTASSVSGVAVQGRYAYVSTGTNTSGFQVFDVSNPASVLQIGSANQSSAATKKKVKVQGKYAYVSSNGLAGTGTFDVFDISNPKLPVLVGTQNYTTTASTNLPALYVQGRYAYVGDGSSRTLWIFDVSNPANIPTATPFLNTGAAGSGIADLWASGKYLYLANAGATAAQFQTLDISTPTSPTIIGTITNSGVGTSISGAVTSLAVQGRYAYVGNSTGSVFAVDLKDPAFATPVVTSVATSGTGAASLYAQGRMLYVADNNSNRITAVDISTPGTPLAVSSYSNTAGSAAAQAVTGSGRYLYVGSGNATYGFQVFDMGGTYSQQLETGGLETDTLNVRSNSNVAGDETVQGSLSVGTNALIQGEMSVGGNSKYSGNLIAGNYQTSTTATTFGTGTNTTTLVFTGTTSFACGDVVFIDNAGQDYYTRITSCPGTAASVTVSPAVDFDNGVTVRKYIVQNIGSISTSAAAPSNSDRFFQGYFLGGIVTGAGSTSLSDNTLQSTGKMNYIATSHAFTSTNTTQNGLSLASNSLTTGSGLSVSTSSTTLSSGALLSVSQNSNYTSSSASSSQLLNISRTIANTASVPSITYSAGTMVNNSTTASVTVPSASNTILIAGGVGNFACSSFTWAVSGFGTQTSTGATAPAGFYTYVYLLNPNPGTGTLTCNAALTGSVTAWTNVDQTSPFSGNYNACSGSYGGVSTCNITLASGEAAISGLNQQSSYSCYNRTSPFTKINQFCSGASVFAAGYYTGGSGTVNAGWTYPEGDSYLVEAVALKRAVPTVAYSGSLAAISSTCTANAGTLCSDSSNLLAVTQSTAGATGAVLNIQNAGLGSTVLLNNTSTGKSIDIQSSGTSVFTISNTASNEGAAVFKSKTDNTNAFQIQNANGTSIFNVRTSEVTAAGNLIANPSFETDASSWTNTTRSSVYHTSGSWGGNITGTTTATATLTGNLTNSQTYTLSYNASLSGFTTLTPTVAGQTCTGYYYTDTARGVCVFTVPGSGTYNTVAFALAFGIGYVDGVRLEAGNTAGIYSAAGATTISGNVDIQNSAGGSMLNVNSGTGNVTVGSAGIAGTVQIGNTTGAVAQTINIGNNSTASSTSTIVIGSTIGTSPVTLQSGTTGVKVKGASSTTAFQVQDASANGLLVVDSTNGLVKVALGSGSASSAVCSTLSNGASPAAATAYELRDCNSAPAADYAENYPVASGIDYGDIVATGTNMVNTYGETNGNIDWDKVKGQVTQLVKTDSPYQNNTIGIVSDNHGDFTSAGYNIKQEDNPMPVALNGRVPVNISPSSGAIAAGDYLTTSGDSGKAIKATGAGYVIGKALASWNPGTGGTQVMVYVEPGYYNGPTMTDYIQNGGSASLMDLNVSGIATIQTLSVTGSATFHGNIIVGGHVITAGNTPDTEVLSSAGAGATITIDGNDTAGTITITTGGGATAGDLGKLIFNNAFGKAPKTILSAQDEASQDAKIFPTGKSASQFILHTSQALPAGTYTFDYFIVQ